MGSYQIKLRYLLQCFDLLQLLLTVLGSGQIQHGIGIDQSIALVVDSLVEQAIVLTDHEVVPRIEGGHDHLSKGFIDQQQNIQRITIKVGCKSLQDLETDLHSKSFRDADTIDADDTAKADGRVTVDDEG